MLEVSSDPHKNILYVTVSGHFSAEEIDSAAESVRQELQRLRPNFNLISDIRSCHPTDAEGVAALQRAVQRLQEQGLGRVVRVAKLPISAAQMDRVSQAAGYEPVQVYSLEEAERILTTRLNPDIPVPPPSWETVRKYRRISVGPEHTIRFSMGGQDFESIHIANLSAQGCFAVVPRHWGSLLYEGAILIDFALNHADLPSTRISAKVVRYVRNLTEISEDDVGLGIMYLSPPASFLEWVDAYVSAFFDVVP